MHHVTMKAFYLVLCLATPSVVFGQNGEMDRFSRKPRPMHSDVQYLLCPVCKMAVEEVWKQTEAARAVAPYGKVGEDDLIDMATHICDADSDEGDWIPMYDITQEGKGSSIKIERQEYMGECRRECRTIASTCAKVFDEYREDIAEALYKKEPKTLEKLTSRVCTKWAKVCPAKPVASSYLRKDEFWYPMDEDSWKMRNMEKTMNKLSQKAGSQQVKFVDPMGGMMMGSDGWDDEEDEMDPMMQMMGGMGGMGGGYGDPYGDMEGMMGGEL
mmetsp:Transcript_22299/g.29162  ORF Transcript_22299/g.29162 Transcript_22299/m.29162 type:complete len:271 (+) Transcript_22299:19-831(+)